MKTLVADVLTLLKENIIHTFFVDETASDSGGKLATQKLELLILMMQFERLV